MQEKGKTIEVEAQFILELDSNDRKWHIIDSTSYTLCYKKTISTKYYASSRDMPESISFDHSIYKMPQTNIFLILSFSS